MRITIEENIPPSLLAEGPEALMVLADYLAEKADPLKIAETIKYAQQMACVNEFLGFVSFIVKRQVRKFGPLMKVKVEWDPGREHVRVHCVLEKYGQTKEGTFAVSEKELSQANSWSVCREIEQYVREVENTVFRRVDEEAIYEG